MRFILHVLSTLSMVNTFAYAEGDGCQNIVDIACESSDFSALCSAVQLVELEGPLSQGKWTIFAPIDNAFAELDDDFFDMIFDDHVLLKDILLFHAVAADGDDEDDVIQFNDLICTGLIEMANGQDSRTVCQDGGNKIFQKGGSNPRNDMPQIIQSDIETCQGYIHVIDEVMLPGRLITSSPTKDEDEEEEDDSCQSIADIICNEDNDFSIFCDTLELAELDHPLRDGGHWTVFAPTDDAFDEFDQTLLEVVLGDTELLSYVLLFHMVQNNILYVDDLECMHTIEMANGRDSRHVCIGRNSGNTNESLYQKGSGNPRNDMPQIIDTDIEACNGVIHMVNRIMLPPL